MRKLETRMINVGQRASTLRRLVSLLPAVPPRVTPGTLGAWWPFSWRCVQNGSNSGASFSDFNSRSMDASAFPTTTGFGAPVSAAAARYDSASVGRAGQRFR